MPLPMSFMSSDSRTASVLVAAGLVLAAVYILSSLGVSGPTAAFVSLPGTLNIFLVSMVVVLGVAALWYAEFRTK